MRSVIFISVLVISDSIRVINNVAKDLESAMAYGEKAEEIEKKLKIFDVKEN
jgi:hypothetical protein